MGASRLLPALLLSWPLSGCGILVQTMVGWNTEETTRKTKTHELRIESAPAGAQVARSDADGPAKILGATPLVDRLDYQIEETVSSPRAWGLLGTGIAEVAVGAILAGVGPSQRKERCDVRDFGLDCETGGGAPFFVAGGSFLVFGAVDAIWGLIRLFQRDEITSTRVVGEPTYTYVVEKDGASRNVDIAIPSARTAMIDLGTGEVVASNAPPPAPPPPIELDARVVAVMDVEDANAGDRGAVGDVLVRNLSDQLRIFVAQQGVKTIDRTAQERAFHAQLQALKTESYESCYDDGCQIELGKALAASHILRSKITKFGSRCVLNGELIDLVREVTIKAASAQGTCQDEGFLEMSETLARDLMKH